jgi:hypothetical protein
MLTAQVLSSTNGSHYEPHGRGFPSAFPSAFPSNTPFPPRGMPRRA